MARYDALGLTAPPRIDKDGPLRGEFEKVKRRAAELRRLRAEGRWIA